MKRHQIKLYNEDLDKTLEHSIGTEKLWNKSILITGATGTIGSFVTDALLRLNQTKGANIKIFLAARNKEKARKLYEAYDSVEFLNYRMDAPITFDVPVDYVIHAAGNAHPVAFNEDPVGTIVGNIESTFQLLEYAKTHGGQRFLYVSSGEVYGQGESGIETFDETYSGYVDIVMPRSCYPLSKRVTENLCVNFWKQYGLGIVIVRPCHTYGPGMTANDSRAHAQFFNSGLEGKQIIMKSAGIQMRSYNYVADCVSALLTVLTCGEDGEAYNLANPHSKLTIADLARKIAIFAKCDVVFERPTKIEMANQSPILKQVLNTDKVEKLGWQPAFSIDDGISHTLKILAEINS